MNLKRIIGEFKSIIDLSLLVCPWFLKINFVHDVSMGVCLCVSAPEAINN